MQSDRLAAWRLASPRPEGTTAGGGLATGVGREDWDWRGSLAACLQVGNPRAMRRGKIANLISIN